MTICFIWILPAFHLNYKTPQVLKVLKLDLFLILKNLWKATSFHQQNFSVQHDYDLSLLNQEIDTPSDNLNHQDTHVCEKQGQDAFLIHDTDLSNNFALPQFMRQHNCEDLKPTDTPSTVSTFIQLPVIMPPIQFVLITQ